MNKIRLLHRLIGYSLLLAFIVNLGVSQPVVASTEKEIRTAQTLSSQVEPLPEESIKLSSPYPILRATAGDFFEFKVELYYHGSKARVFDLAVTSNSTSSYAYILASFASSNTMIESILLKPDPEFPDEIKVRYTPKLSKKIEPGKYVVTLRASSGNISDSIDLTAVVTTRYELLLATSTGRLNADITAGKENHIGLLAINNSSVDLNDVRLSANVPQNWGINFVPNVIDTIGVENRQSFDMIIRPDSNTIAGDYEIKVMAIHSDTNSQINLRITVATPTIWGWISVLIIIVIIAGLVAIFLRLGRR